MSDEKGIFGGGFFIIFIFIFFFLFIIDP